jgi:putative Ca2+/H+ antiporter (TMEM165/GDT1 family)
MTAFFHAFGLVGLAEVGDKSALLCLALGARTPPSQVAIGALLAFATLNAVGVAVGGAVGAWMPERAVAVVSGLLFLVFGALAIKDAAEQGDEDLDAGGAAGIVGSALAIGLSEMGDKTQIAVALLASREPVLPVWAGATAALALNATLFAFAGRMIADRLPVRPVKLAAGGLFVATGAYQLWAASG